MITNLCVLLVSFHLGAFASTDELESLIDKEKVEVGSAEEEAVPPAFLFGDKTSVEIYSAAAYAGQPSPLCEQLSFDELIDMAGGNPLDAETVLNMRSPRVREVLERACLIRPGDEILAVNAGRQEWIVIREFLVRRGRAVCPDDSPYVLVGRLERTLEEDPLFYSTSSDLKEGNNGYSGMVFEKTNTDNIRNVISEAGDYQVGVASVNATEVDRFYSLKRRRVTPEDDGFPNEILLWQKNDQIAVVSQEQVDRYSGSGHLSLEGTFDFNGDGYIDLWVKGDQRKCPYHLLFQGGESGFQPIELPNPPCSC